MEERWLLNGNFGIKRETGKEEQLALLCMYLIWIRTGTDNPYCWNWNLLLDETQYMYYLHIIHYVHITTILYSTIPAMPATNNKNYFEFNTRPSITLSMEIFQDLFTSLPKYIKIFIFLHESKHLYLFISVYRFNRHSLFSRFFELVKINSIFYLSL